ncbi:ferritin family protein [Virgibacillus sp. LDC-1]|uniref:ferritin family protein n=1 Tax=Virgibacillus sp. LDC-1 TaxID=3039856 RepID=UPI0024DE39F4|nr:ferritin family protein [Virgibacillus sp. LDC-1]
MYSNSYWNLNPNNSYIDSRLVKDLRTAISGEYSAIICYEKLASLAPTIIERDQIWEIIKDERRHLQTFSSIYVNVTGEQPTPQIIEECSNTYKEGLISSFKDEQETVDFYLDIVDRTSDNVVKEAFRRAADDEQNHAVWFNFSLRNMQEMPHRQTEAEYGAKGALNASTLSLPQMLTFALQDEFLAQSRYNDILLNFGYVRTFANIQEAELRHIRLLLPLFTRYQVPIPEDISRMFVTTPQTIKDAYALGVQGEIENIGMYEKFLSQNLPSDVQAVFTQLHDASLNHLAAFERGLARA